MELLVDRVDRGPEARVEALGVRPEQRPEDEPSGARRLAQQTSQPASNFASRS